MLSNVSVECMVYRSSTTMLITDALDVFAQGQEIKYCGDNAHFQSGVAEKRIRDLQDLTRTSLLHAAARWPKAILVHLWPYAL